MSHTAEEWTSIRDRAVLLGQLVQGLTLEELEAWIEQGDRALSIGFVLHPTAARDGADQLQKQLRYMRAVHAFRRAVAEAIGVPGIGVTE